MKNNITKNPYLHMFEPFDFSIHIIDGEHITEEIDVKKVIRDGVELAHTLSQ